MAPSGDEDNIDAAAPRRRTPTRESNHQATTPRRSVRRPTPSTKSSPSSVTPLTGGKKTKPTSKAGCSTGPKITPQATRKSRSKTSASKKTSSKKNWGRRRRRERKKSFAHRDVCVLVQLYSNSEKKKVPERFVVPSGKDIQTKFFRVPNAEEGPHKQLGLSREDSLMRWNYTRGEWVRFIPKDTDNLRSKVTALLLAICLEKDLKDKESLELYVRTDDRVGLGELLKDIFNSRYCIDEFTTLDSYFNLEGNFQTDVVDVVMRQGRQRRSLVAPAIIMALVASICAIFPEHKMVAAAATAAVMAASSAASTASNGGGENEGQASSQQQQKDPMNKRRRMAKDTSVPFQPSPKRRATFATAGPSIEDKAT